MLNETNLLLQNAISKAKKEYEKCSYIIYLIEYDNGTFYIGRTKKINILRRFYLHKATCKLHIKNMYFLLLGNTETPKQNFIYYKSEKAFVVSFVELYKDKLLHNVHLRKESNVEKNSSEYLVLKENAKKKLIKIFNKANEKN